MSFTATEGPKDSREAPGHMPTTADRIHSTTINDNGNTTVGSSDAEERTLLSEEKQTPTEASNEIKSQAPERVPIVGVEGLKKLAKKLENAKAEINKPSVGIDLRWVDYPQNLVCHTGDYYPKKYYDKLAETSKMLFCHKSVADADIAPIEGTAQYPTNFHFSSDQAKNLSFTNGNLPLRGHTRKRSDGPPLDANGRLMCRFPECGALRFGRRCEWSKHMDKHDRPYRCHKPGCEKLQGFTYSVGLLRHVREAHKYYGSKITPLFCPDKECKRSSGWGFTRKENLAEHIRRIHRGESASFNRNTLFKRNGYIIVFENKEDDPQNINLSIRNGDFIWKYNLRSNSQTAGSKHHDSALLSVAPEPWGISSNYGQGYPYQGSGWHFGPNSGMQLRVRLRFIIFAFPLAFLSGVAAIPRHGGGAVPGFGIQAATYSSGIVATMSGFALINVPSDSRAGPVFLYILYLVWALAFFLLAALITCWLPKALRVSFSLTWVVVDTALVMLFSHNAATMAEGLFTYVPFLSPVSVFFSFIWFNYHKLAGKHESAVAANGEDGLGQGFQLRDLPPHTTTPGAQSNTIPAVSRSSLESAAAATEVSPFIVGDDEDRQEIASAPEPQELP